MLVLVALLGCQEPFGYDRHDLRGFRIAALTAPRMDGTLRPRAALVVDGRLWSDEPVSLDWGWVDEPDDAWSLDTFVASGPSPVLPERAGHLALRARWDGQEARAVLAPDDRPAVQPLVGFGSLTVDDTELDRETRLTWSDAPADTVQPGAFGRLTVTGVPADTRARFMATGGTFLELDPTRADWVAGELALEDEEVLRGPELQTGPVSVLVLLLDGATGFAARDLFVGGVPAGSWVDGRFLPGGLDEPYLGTLVADDASPTGLAVQGASPDDGTGWDAGSLGCTDVSGPFRPSWLLDQRCTRSDLVGRTVYVEPDR